MYLTISDIKRLVFDEEKIKLTDAVISHIEESYNFLKDFASQKIIYGINTGFGPMAQWHIEDSHLKELQYNIIRSHSTGMGKPLEDIYVKAAMIARLGSFMQAKSGVHIELINLLTEFINRDIIPFVPEHGSVGASGDLVQLAHIALCLIGEGKVHYKGEWLPTSEVMQKENMQPIEIHIREGLSSTNGTSVMTGIAAINQLYADRLLDIAILAGVWINEVAGSYDDLMSEPLNKCRRHKGQQLIASRMRELAKGSKCLLKREHELYNGMHREKVFEHKVQPYYSLRCLPQILGPVLETFEQSKLIIEEELNSTSDNPIIDPETQNVYHGGNFHGDYISLEQDKMKIVVVRLTQTAERQLNYLFHDRINGILPPFLNAGVLGLNYGMQACQFTATSTTAESQTLAMPNYVHTIPNNNDNQDIVSMGTNTALLTKKVIDNAFQVMSILFMALAQATDILQIKDKLAPATREAYCKVRELVAMINEDKLFNADLEKICTFLMNLGNE
ncbi:MAG: aromatic amino acid lyase [Paludibacteraceae bacterium]|nr:aromatic amino acid lyase [Paludibacteraceae bacterium]